MGPTANHLKPFPAEGGERRRVLMDAVESIRPVCEAGTQVSQDTVTLPRESVDALYESGRWSNGDPVTFPRIRKPFDETGAPLLPHQPRAVLNVRTLDSRSLCPSRRWQSRYRKSKEA